MRKIRCNLKEIREAIGVSQAELAKLSRLSARTIARAETGSPTQFWARKLIARTLFGPDGWDRRDELWPDMVPSKLLRQPLQTKKQKPKQRKSRG